MEFKKVYKTALCVIPPKDVWEQIQAIRKIHDSTYERWMPHFNYLYPFVGFEEFPEAEKLLKEKMKNIEPFKVKVEKFGYFSQKDVAVLWVKPESDVLQKLHNEITKVYEANRKDFKPHISVGQFPKNEVQKMMEKFQKEWKPIEFIVNEICLIGRYGNDDPMKVRSILHFGKENKSTIKIFPIEKQKENYNVHIGGLSSDVTEKNLEEIFIKYNVKKVDIVKDKNNGLPKGFGFLEFENEKDQKTVIAKMNGYKINNKAIKLNKAK
eukprot:gene7930-12398_t